MAKQIKCGCGKEIYAIGHHGNKTKGFCQECIEIEAYSENGIWYIKDSIEHSNGKIEMFVWTISL